METISQQNYPYQAAGRLWLVPELCLTRMPDGTLAIMQDEIDRIHRAIANEICGSPDPLTNDELEFLCDVTLTSFDDEVAESLEVHKSTLTKWRKSREDLPPWTNLLLKKRFWFKIFLNSQWVYDVDVFITQPGFFETGLKDGFVYPQDDFTRIELYSFDEILKISRAILGRLNRP